MRNRRDTLLQEGDMSMGEEFSEEARRFTEEVEASALRHWEEREREWWEEADDLGKYLPRVKRELVRCAKEAFIAGYATRVLEEMDTHTPQGK
jgi:hypothetical protein